MRIMEGWRKMEKKGSNVRWKHNTEGPEDEGKGRKMTDGGREDFDEGEEV